MKNEKEELKAALLLGEADSASVDAIIAEKSEEKLRKLRKAQLIKLGIILVFAAIVVVFMTI